MKTVFNVLLAFIAGMTLMGFVYINQEQKMNRRNQALVNLAMEQAEHINALQDTVEDEHNKAVCLHEVVYDLMYDHPALREEVRNNENFEIFAELIDADVEDLCVIYKN